MSSVNFAIPDFCSLNSDLSGARAGRVEALIASGTCSGCITSRPADKPVATDQKPQRQFDRLLDPDARCGFNLESHGPQRLPHHQLAARDIGPVVGAGDAERHGEFGRARCQVLYLARGRPAPAHEVEPHHRFERANQDATGRAGGFADQIEALIHPIDKVDVGVARRPEDHFRARGDAPRGVGGLVARGEVRFGLHDDARGAAVDQDFAGQVARDVDRRAGVKGARQDGTKGHSSQCTMALMRLFTGLDLPQDVVANLERLLGELRPAARIGWSVPANLHITTKFIGEWPDERLEELKHALAAVEARAAIEVAVRKVGFFPNARAPRVFWCGVEAPALARLAADIDHATLRLGVEPEKRAYSPHLTLARIKERQDLSRLHAAVERLGGIEFGQFAARRFFLYQSRLQPGGSVYTKLAEFPFTS